MMTMILLLFVLMLTAADTALIALVFLRIYRNAGEEQLERKVQESISRRRDPMDEGIENILTFSVNGKTGFEDRSRDEE